MKKLLVFATAAALGRSFLPHHQDIAYMGGLQITHRGKRPAQWKQEQARTSRGRRR
jgi:hypothetical protein